MSNHTGAAVASLDEHRERRERYLRPETPKLDAKARKTAKRGLAKARRALERAKAGSDE